LVGRYLDMVFFVPEKRKKIRKSTCTCQHNPHIVTALLMQQTNNTLIPDTNMQMPKPVPINEAIAKQMAEMHQHVNMMREDQQRSLLWLESFMLMTMCTSLREMIHAREQGIRVW